VLPRDVLAILRRRRRFGGTFQEDEHVTTRFPPVP
jgi:hypothetical protein